MALTPGDRVGSYEIITLLGAGGMGEVYRARDSQLGRDVAIKVLPARFAEDTGLLARSEREARALAALNHPNVGAIYGLEAFSGGWALILELVEGRTLAESIERSALPVTETIRIAAQIASAVDAAHKKGIIHRDLKPANIKITSEGAVKVLDFGLAKIAMPSEHDHSQSATVTSAGTQAGAVLGTAGYMSPEQARGDAVDTRTDIWAIGCILYEMLTGRRAFDGRTLSDTIAKVLEREPDWSALPRGTPPAIRDLLKRCLSKEPPQRIQDASAVRALLDAAVSGATPMSVPVVAVAGVAAIVIVAGAVLAYRWVSAAPVDPTNPAQWEQLTDFPDAAVQPAVSPDGRMLAFIRGEATFATPGEVYLKQLPGGDATPLTRDGRTKMDPVFSPDGNRLAYTVTDATSAMSLGWDTWEVPVIRGEPRFWKPNASGLTWLGPNVVQFSAFKRGSHMGIVTATEGSAETTDVYFPAVESWMAHRSARSPDGKWVLVVEMAEGGVFTPCRLVPIDKTLSSRQVGPSSGPCTSVAWSPDGRRMYFSVNEGNGFHLWQQVFPDGQPERLTIGPTTEEEGLAVLPDGRSLITSVGRQQRGILIRDASGERQISLEGYAFWPMFSGDGQKLAFRVSRGPAGGNSPSELWMTDLATGRFDRIFPGQQITAYDLSRDDRIVASVVEADGKTRLWLTSLDGRQAPRRVASFEGGSPRFGPSGEIVFIATEEGMTSLFLTDFQGSTRRALNPGAPTGPLGTVSPDGAWISVFAAGEMKAVPFAGGAPVTILRGSVSRMRWTPDGKRVLLSIQLGQGPSAFGFGRTYALPLDARSTLPRMPPGGFKSDAEIAAVPGVEIIPFGDVHFSSTPGVHAFSKIRVTRNLFRIPLR